MTSNITKVSYNSVNDYLLCVKAVALEIVAYSKSKRNAKRVARLESNILKLKEACYAKFGCYPDGSK